ncbi:MAG: DUF1064 domain-containing protein [Candidatus Hatepunaea meridiana]|nr:DUF1064 domain-containing protein [Candidatus Hatepunaea meridiana]
MNRFNPRYRSPGTRKNARGRTNTKNGMNSLELRYANHLRTLLLAGEIHSFSFERHNLKLADKTYYKPDFEVMLPDGSIEFHEVKGFMRDDANVKIKVAAAQFPQYVFRLVQWDRNIGWKIKPYPPHNK